MTTLTGPVVRIRDLRIATGMSVTDLAARLADAGQPVHPDTIRNVELGHRRASAPLLNAWARALGILPVDVWQPPIDAPAYSSVDGARVPTLGDIAESLRTMRQDGITRASIEYALCRVWDEPEPASV